MTAVETQTFKVNSRKKRDKYVNCACFECKRRKIKCNGNDPCKRCDKLQLSCEYPSKPRARKRSKTTSSYETTVRKRPELFGIPPEEAERLILAYDTELNSMYPIFDDGAAIKMYRDLGDTYLQTHQLPKDSTTRRCKLALAIGAGISNSWRDKAAKLYQDVLDEVFPKAVHEEPNFDLLLTMIMIHHYQFHTDQGKIGYRTLAFTSTIAYELGLHSSKELEERYSDPVRREYYRQVFWCVYILDRRLSLYTRRPVILDDNAIDQKFPRLHGSGLVDSTENDMYRAMHLNYMIHFSQIAGKVLSGVHDSDSLETMMKEWMESLPPELTNIEQNPPKLSKKLRSVLHLKSNLMLLQIYSASASKSYSVAAVNAARECVRELNRLYNNTELYNSCQIQYNHFLVSALDVLYSATQSDPVTMGQLCHSELNMALRLVNQLLASSGGSDHNRGSIWQLISSFATKLGYTAQSLERLNPKLVVMTNQQPAPQFDEMLDLDSLLKNPFEYDQQPDILSHFTLTESSTTSNDLLPLPDNDTLFKTLEDLFKPQVNNQ